MPRTVSTEKLGEIVDRLVKAARKAGADAADAVAVLSRSKSVAVRFGKVEGTNSSEDDSISLRVFVGKRVASVSANYGADPAELAERAVVMARASPEDPYQSLADRERLATSFPDLDLFDGTDVGAQALTDDAVAMEEAALAINGVTNSGSSAAGAGLYGLVLATSDGFLGSYASSRFSRSVSVIAGEGTAMERDYDYCTRIFFDELESPEVIGRRAGERAVRRLGAQKADTGKVPVVFDPRVARGLAATLAGAINGAAVARKTSFWRDRMGKQVAAGGITVTDNPFIRRGPASRPFDGEGVAGEPLTMIEDGVLNHWFLSTAVGRELGLKTNGRAVRSSSSVSPSSTNLAIEPGSQSPEVLIGNIDSGFYVTELFGHGTNMVTGEYSRGASGFLIEKGEITRPVSEVTIAANLKDMFMNMVAADDIDRNYSNAAPTLLVEGMTLAGR